MPFVVMQVDPVASATRVVRADGGMVTLADGLVTAEVGAAVDRGVVGSEARVIKLERVVVAIVGSTGTGDGVGGRDEIGVNGPNGASGRLFGGPCNIAEGIGRRAIDAARLCLMWFHSWSPSVLWRGQWCGMVKTWVSWRRTHLPVRAT